MWQPDEITFEAPERYPEPIATLAAVGHTVVRTGPTPQGDAHVILELGRTDYLGAADRRRSSGRASGS